MGGGVPVTTDLKTDSAQALEQNKGAAELSRVPRPRVKRPARGTCCQPPRHPAISHTPDANGRESRAVTWQPAFHLPRERLGLERALTAPAERGFPPHLPPPPGQGRSPSPCPQVTPSRPHGTTTPVSPPPADSACASRLPAYPRPQGLLGLVVFAGCSGPCR